MSNLMERDTSFHSLYATGTTHQNLFHSSRHTVHRGTLPGNMVRRRRLWVYRSIITEGWICHVHYFILMFSTRESPAIDRLFRVHFDILAQEEVSSVNYKSSCWVDGGGLISSVTHTGPAIHQWTGSQSVIQSFSYWCFFFWVPRYL